MFNKKYRLLFVIELVVALIVIINIIIPHKSYSIDYKENTVLSLGFGRYFINVDYESEDTSIVIRPTAVESNSKWYSGSVLTVDQILSKDRNYNSFEMWVSGLRTDVNIEVSIYGDTYNNIKSITVTETRFADICMLIIVGIVMALTYISYRIKIKSISINKECIITAASIAGIAIVASLPAFSSYIPLGYDSNFHILRIEGIKDGLLAGQFPVKVEPTYLEGFGYAVSTFYGSLLMYVPAVLRLIGFSLQFSYKFYILFVNSIMAVSSYFLFKEISSGRKYGIIGSCLYTLSVYRFSIAFYRGAMGEITAMAILPIAALGLWNIYTKPYDEHYKNRWILPALGFTGIIQSHIISTEIVGAFTVFICLILAKKTFKKETFVVLLKTVGAALLLNIGFFVPLIESLTTLQMVGNQWNNVTAVLQEQGVALRDLFVFEMPSFDTEVWYMQVYIIGLGLSLGIGLIMSVCVLIKKAVKKENIKELVFFQIMSFILIFVITSKFPWNKIIELFRTKLGSIGVFIANMIANIQYPYRIAIVTTLFIVIAIIISLKELEKDKKILSTILFTLLIGITVIQCILLETSVITTEVNSKEQIPYIYDNSGYSMNTGNGEYTPVDSNGTWGSFSSNGSNYFANNVEVLEYSKKYTNVYVKVKNTTDANGTINIPLIYYLGYSAKDLNTNKAVNVLRADNGQIFFVIPAGQEMSIELKYTGKTMWKLCEIISLATFLGIIIYTYNSKKKLIATT